MKHIKEYIKESIFDTDRQMTEVEVASQLENILNLRDLTCRISGNEIEMYCGNPWIILGGPAYDKFHELLPKVDTISSDAMVMISDVKKPDRYIKHITAQRIAFNNCDIVISGTYEGEDEVRMDEVKEVKNVDIICPNGSATFYAATSDHNAHLSLFNIKVDAQILTINGFSKWDISVKGKGTETVEIVIPQKTVELGADGTPFGDLVAALQEKNFSKPLARKLTNDAIENGTFSAVNPLKDLHIDVPNVKVIKWIYLPRGYYAVFHAKGYPVDPYWNVNTDIECADGWTLSVRI